MASTVLPTGCPPAELSDPSMDSQPTATRAIVAKSARIFLSMVLCSSEDYALLLPYLSSIIE
jgi:hypothetical protein